MQKHWLVIAAVLAACCIGLVSAQTDAGTNETTNASITVTDQMVEGDAVVGNVTVDEVVSNGTGWIVIHNNLFGHPGGVIGYTPVESGTNRNVTVTIHTFVATTPSLPSCTTMPGRWVSLSTPSPTSSRRWRARS